MAFNANGSELDVATAARLIAAQEAPANLNDFLISVWVHRLVIARSRVASASATLAECDADARRAGLCLRTLRHAVRKSNSTPANPTLEEAADAYIHAMETVTFGGVTDCRQPGALSPIVPPCNVSSPSMGDPT